MKFLSCEVGEPGLGAGGKWSSLEYLEAGTTAESLWQGASGQDIALGSVNTNCMFCLWTFRGFLLSYKEI